MQNLIGRVSEFLQKLREFLSQNYYLIGFLCQYSILEAPTSQYILNFSRDGEDEISPKINGKLVILVILLTFFRCALRNFGCAPRSSRMGELPSLFLKR